MRIKRVKTNLDQHDFADKIRKKGWKYLASGAFASVYAKRGSRTVIKVGAMGDAYMEYVKAVGIKSKNPLFPKIKSVVIYNARQRERGEDYWRTDDDCYYVVEMERLIPYRKLRNKDRYRALKRLNLEDPCELEYDAHHVAKNTKNKHLRDACKKLIKVWRDNNSDMHEGNIMWRKRGRGHQLVITDPVS
jgi:hypothetical protein